MTDLGNLSSNGLDLNAVVLAVYGLKFTTLTLPDAFTHYTKLITRTHVLI